MLTRSQAANRLRWAAKVAREHAGIPRNYAVEVGIRQKPVHSLTAPSMEDAFADGDDLEQNVDFGLVQAGRAPQQVYQHGYVAHLYFYSRGSWSELTNVVTVWVGTGDLPPVVIHSA